MARSSGQRYDEDVNTNFEDYRTLPSLLAPEQQSSSGAILASIYRDPGWRGFSPEKYIGIAVVNVHTGKMELQAISQTIPMVARVSLIDYRGTTLLDTYVRPTHPIVDYRATQTGLSYSHLCDAPLFTDVQQRIAANIQNKILVGHRIWTFLSVLGLSHPALYTRDLSLFRPMRKRLESRVVVELSTLVKTFMARNMGFQYEDSLEFSRAAMDLFRSCQEIFEEIITAGQWPCDLPPSRFAEHYS